MALLDRIRERTGSDLSDAELSAMIDGITAELDALLGPAGPITVEIGDLLQPYAEQLVTLRLTRPADPAQPITIIESLPGNSGAAAARTTLADGDFRLLHSGRTIIRRSDGPHARSFWAPLIEVTYTPIGEQAARDEATIKLIQLDLSYRGGLKQERAGDYQMTLADDFTAEREKIIAGLAQRRGMVMA